jgi:TatD DNase family protein
MTDNKAYTTDAKISLIDTHCHLEMDAYDRDRDDVIRRAREAGIEAVITIGSDMEGNLGGIELSKKYNFIYCSVGFHPHDAKDFHEEIFERIKKWSRAYSVQGNERRMQNAENSPKVVAIGEIGLDYHYDNSPREIQRNVFTTQLLYAKEANLPVIIHSRKAKKDTLDIIRHTEVQKGVFHCFSGDLDMAEQALELGFYISIAGPVTFKKARRLQDIARVIPDERVLIETDAPYLTPEPLRGRRNEPSNLIYTARAVAELRGISLEDLARVTTLNAKQLFKIGDLPAKGEIAYKIRDNLYLNITNRCTNKCSFCIRFQSDYVKGYNLKLSDEPTEEELKDAIGDPSQYNEIVFCGYGEPLLRLDLVKHLASWIKANRGKVRINTNGHGNLIHKRNILPELKGLVDRISISLDAHDEATYNRICKPEFQNAYTGILSFIREAKEYIPEVQITVVTQEGIDVEKCRRIAEEFEVGFRIRKLDVVG